MCLLLGVPCSIAPLTGSLRGGVCVCVCVGLGARSLPLRDGGTTGGLCVIGIDDHYGLCVGTNGGHSTLLHATSQRVWHYIPTLFSGNAFICLASFYSLIHNTYKTCSLPPLPLAL